MDPHTSRDPPFSTPASTSKAKRDTSLYKKDALVTVEDIEALVEKKRVELGVLPFSELKCSLEEASQ